MDLVYGKSFELFSSFGIASMLVFLAGVSLVEVLS